jgi:hypothetical protein
MKQKRLRSIVFKSSLRKKRSIGDIKKKKRKESTRKRPSRRDLERKLRRLRGRDV